MLDVLYMEAFAGYSVLEVGSVAVLLGAVVWTLKRMFSRKASTAHMVEANCTCGWSGKVSRYTRRCPACNNTI